MSRNEVRIIGGLWKGRKLKVPANAAVRPSLGRVRETLFNWLAGHVEGSDCLDLFAGSGALGFEALSRGARSAVLVDNNRGTVDALHKNAQRLGAANCSVRRQSALAFLKRTAADGAAVPGGTAVPGGLADASKGTPASGTHDAPGFIDLRADSGTPTSEPRAGSGADSGTPTSEPAVPRGVAVATQGTPAQGTPTPGRTVNRWDIVFLDPPFASDLLGAALHALQSCKSLRPGARVYFELERRGEIDLEGWTVLKHATAGDARFGLLASP